MDSPFVRRSCVAGAEWPRAFVDSSGNKLLFVPLNPPVGFILRVTFWGLDRDPATEKELFLPVWTEVERGCFHVEAAGKYSLFYLLS